jgi:hypothetical protein
MANAPDCCPGCAARIPPTRPPFCEYCGATLPLPAVPAVDANSAEIERRLAALQTEAAAAPRSSGSLGMLIVVVVVVGAVLALGCCALLGVRVVPPR